MFNIILVQTPCFKMNCMGAALSARSKVKELIQQLKKEQEKLQETKNELKEYQ